MYLPETPDDFLCLKFDMIYQRPDDKLSNLQNKQIRPS